MLYVLIRTYVYVLLVAIKPCKTAVFAIFCKTTREQQQTRAFNTTSKQDIQYTYILCILSKTPTWRHWFISFAASTVGQIRKSPNISANKTMQNAKPVLYLARYNKL